MRKEIFSEIIIDWYEANHRKLPWRQTRDPYKIWLSEVMLQQTRVAQGLPYYEKFVVAFPTVQSLANASEQSVLRLWQGLGYYSRARNLHRCAREVATAFKGKFPNTFAELKKLPGIGEYTAAAIASIAYKEPVAVVDGNVFRVLARVFGIETDIATNEGKKSFSALANSLLDKKRPDLFNQGLMEFGALHCLPKNPKCNECIFSTSCQASQKNLQAVLPLKARKLKVRIRHFNYFVIHHENKILMKLRGAKDIWQGLYDFYLIETKRSSTPDSLIKNDALLAGGEIIGKSKLFTHLLSHQRLKVKFVEVKLPDAAKATRKIDKSGLTAFSRKEIKKLPKPILIDRFF